MNKFDQKQYESRKKAETILVFYDGACGLCSKEINHYKKVAPSGVFDWIDLIENPEPFSALGYSQLDGLKELHVRDKQGQIHTGVNAFAVMWRELKNWRWLAVFIKLPVVNFVAQKLYDWFARWRFQKLGYCQWK